MDQHPIPQDVTGFQFKLIGAMTVKQFGYVACGVIMAVVLYYLPLQTVFGILLKLILIPLFGVSGVIVAFVPIDGRSIDVMATNFARALFSPNQYVYKRQGRKLSFSSITVSKTPTTQAQKEQVHGTASSVAAKKFDEKEKKLQEYLLNSQGRTKNEMDKKESAFLKTLSLPTIQPITISPTLQSSVVTNSHSAPAIKQTLAPTIKPLEPKTQPTTPPLPIQKSSPAIATAKPLVKTPEELSQKEVQLEKELTQAKQEALATPPTVQPVGAQQKVETLSKQIQDIHSEKLRLEQELSHLKNQLTQQKSPTPPTPKVPTQPMQDPQHVRTIAQTVTKKAGLPHVSDTPNVVVGIVKDPRGNVLPNILVEVKDKDNNPVRAFKTNLLGQFASATPLGLGTYTIELDDPKNMHRFDVIQITANNKIMLPIEIISHDAREDLRKQLFAT